MNTTHTTAVLRIARKHRKSIRNPGAALRRGILGAGIAALLLLPVGPAFAGSDAWKAVPGTNIWNTAGNWVGGSVPNGVGDTATFATSGTRGVTITSGISLSGITFNLGASAFTITALNAGGSLNVNL